MATNRDMLKEAIAEAKAIKETAVANAKLALEEAFTPQMKSILSAKIQEMAMEDEEAIEETYDEMDEALGTINNPNGPTAHGNVAEEMEEEVDLDELLAEIEAEEMDENITEAKDEEENEEEEKEEEEEEGEPLDLEDMTDEDLKKMIEDVIADMMENGELKLDDEGEEEGEEIDMDLNMDAEEGDMEELEEDFNLEALLNEIENETSTVEETTLTVNEVETTNAELEEAKNVIETLRAELNEINLLNAKLLYTNKIFKSKTLNESQKVKVLSSFDKATTVKEVKLVYETLNEGLKVKTTNIRENLGSASKATITPKVTTRQPIIESNDSFARMRELAFYNSKH